MQSASKKFGVRSPLRTNDILTRPRDTNDCVGSRNEIKQENIIRREEQEKGKGLFKVGDN